LGLQWGFQLISSKPLTGYEVSVLPVSYFLYFLRAF
jgi:hypothetical protein